MIEFKQIIGRGTRLFEGKDYFTIHDFVKASAVSATRSGMARRRSRRCARMRAVPVRMREAGAGAVRRVRRRAVRLPGRSVRGVRADALRLREEPKKRVKVKLADGKERQIQHMMVTTFWHPDGTPMSAQQFMEALFGKLPEFFQNEGSCATCGAAGHAGKLLAGLAEKGFGGEQLAEMQKLISAEKSDLFDVLAYVAYTRPPVTREERLHGRAPAITTKFKDKQQAFLDFVLAQYVQDGRGRTGAGKAAAAVEAEVQQRDRGRGRGPRAAGGDRKGVRGLPAIPVLAGTAIRLGEKPPAWKMEPPAIDFPTQQLFPPAEESQAPPHARTSGRAAVRQKPTLECNHRRQKHLTAP